MDSSPSSSSTALVTSQLPSPSKNNWIRVVPFLALFLSFLAIVITIFCAWWVAHVLLPRTAADILGSVENLSGQVQTLKEQLSTFKAVEKPAADWQSRLEHVEETLSSLQNQVLQRASLVLAVGQLRQAIMDGRPFQSEMVAVQALVDPAKVSSQEPLKILQTASSQGVSSIYLLSRQLHSLIEPALAAEAEAKAHKKWKQRWQNWLSPFFRLRSVGPNTPGSSLDARLARAEAAMDHNDLHAAVAELEGISEAATQVLSPWLAAAKTRLNVEQAVAILTQQALGQLAGSLPKAEGDK